jgi:hypothetical protein
MGDEPHEHRRDDERAHSEQVAGEAVSDAVVLLAPHHSRPPDLRETIRGQLMRTSIDPKLTFIH